MLMVGRHGRFGVGKVAPVRGPESPGSVTHATEREEVGGEVQHKCCLMLAKERIQDHNDTRRTIDTNHHRFHMAEVEKKKSHQKLLPLWWKTHMVRSDHKTQI